MGAELIQFKNCRLVREHALIHDDLWIRDGKIINPEPIFFDEKVKSYQSIDCQNAIIAPGFIDIQINGGYGVDFSFNTTDVAGGIDKVAKRLVHHGVTSFCPTLVTSPPETYRTIMPQIPKKITNGANILGMHLEGPFISELKKGAHPANCIRDFDKGIDSLFETYGSLDNVKIITLAPEKDATGSITRYLTEQQGITVSLGHSQGNLCDGEKIVQNGANLITHLFNAMLPFHHRDPGLVGLLASDVITTHHSIYFSIISDGVHTHPAALRIAHRTNPEGLILVTDAISALGLEEGVHHIGQMQMEVREGKAFISGTDTLCGSIAALDECMRNFKTFTGCSTVYAIETVTLHPAQCLGITSSKGTLNFGADADFVLLNEDLQIMSTWIDGENIYSQNCSCTTTAGE